MHLRKLLAALVAMALAATGMSGAAASSGEDVDSVTSDVGNGTAAAPFEFPWMASLVQANVTKSDSHFCGGVAIRNTWILTAAHCVADKAPGDVEVVLGAHKRSDRLGARLAVCDIAIHPKYKDTRPWKHDLALLRLCKKHFHPTIGIGIPAEGDDATIAGWGYFDGSQKGSDVLRRGEVTVRNDSFCNDRYDNLAQDLLNINEGYFPDIHTCADEKIPGGWINTCQGDSGGPLLQPSLIPEVGGARPLQVVGITSKGLAGGVDCGKERSSSVFTEPAALYGWIKNVIKDDRPLGYRTLGVACPAPAVAKQLDVPVRYATHIGKSAGTSRGDVMVGRDGANTISAKAGNDYVCGLDGDDTLRGGTGKDVLIGGPGDDELVGNNGADLLDGGKGFDTCKGGAGKDKVRNCEPGDKPVEPGPTPSSNVEANRLTLSTSSACLIGNDGRVDCWGNPKPNGEQFASEIPVEATGITDAISIDGGNGGACAVLANGNARCWGSNFKGVLGIGTSEDAPTPTKVKLTDIAQLDQATSNACAVRTNGHVWCWGANSAGQLGTGEENDLDYFSAVPVRASAISDAVQVGVGSLFACAVRTTGRVSCWGSGIFGPLGTSELTPIDVPGIANAVAIEIASSTSCALRATGVVSCWGNNQKGQAGNGETSSYEETPVDVVGITDATQIATSAGGSCALRSNGTVWCWGNNFNGQLGNGTDVDSLVPTRVKGISNAVEIDRAGERGCALLANGTVRCWGTGRLGNGEGYSTSLEPVNVLDNDGVGLLNVAS